MVLKLYFDLMSQPSRAIYLFLKLNNIPFEAKEVELGKRENLTDGYARINPFKLVPVIDDNGFILTESVAILKYLAVKYNVAEHWYPRTSLQDQARVDEYLNWQHLNTRMQGSMIFLNLIIRTRRGKTIDWELVDGLRTRMVTVIDNIETYFLKNNKPFLCGEDISVADLLAFCELMQLYGCCQEDVYASNEVVNAWMTRVKNKVQMYLNDANKSIDNVRQGFSKIAQQRPKL